MNIFTRFITIISLSLFINVANASLISLELTPQTVGLSDVVTFDLRADFTDEATVGGGLDIFFDSSVLTFSSFVFAGAPGTNPFYDKVPLSLSGKLEGLQFGHDFGFGGNEIIGTLTFLASGIGSTVINMANTTNLFRGGEFISAVSYSSMAGLSFGTASVTVVPEPQTWLLMLAGLGIMGLGLRRKRNTLG